MRDAPHESGWCGIASCCTWHLFSTTAFVIYIDCNDWCWRRKGGVVRQRAVGNTSTVHQYWPNGYLVYGNNDLILRPRCLQAPGVQVRGPGLPSRSDCDWPMCSLSLPRSSVLGVPAAGSAAGAGGGFPSLLLGVINPIFLRTLSR